MMQEILGRLLLSAILAVAFAVAALAFIAGNRVWVRLHRGRNRLTGNVASANPTLLYFWSAGCVQCRFQESQIEQAQVALGRMGRILEVQKVDALAERELAKSMRVMTVPTTVLLDAGGNMAGWNAGLTLSQKIVSQFESIASSQGVPVRNGDE
jgi:thiol-disulfide isomerase/thioredoxin